MAQKKETRQKEEKQSGKTKRLIDCEPVRTVRVIRQVIYKCFNYAHSHLDRESAYKCMLVQVNPEQFRKAEKKQLPRKLKKLTMSEEEAEDSGEVNFIWPDTGEPSEAAEDTPYEQTPAPPRRPNWSHPSRVTFVRDEAPLYGVRIGMMNIAMRTRDRVVDVAHYLRRRDIDIPDLIRGWQYFYCAVIVRIPHETDPRRGRRTVVIGSIWDWEEDTPFTLPALRLRENFSGFDNSPQIDRPETNIMRIPENTIRAIYVLDSAAD